MTNNVRKKETRQSATHFVTEKLLLRHFVTEKLLLRHFVTEKLLLRHFVTEKLLLRHLVTTTICYIFCYACNKATYCYPTICYMRLLQQLLQIINITKIITIK